MKSCFIFGFVLVSIPDAPNGFFVSLKHLDVVHIRLPILDVATMVTCHHPDIVVRPHHATDWAIVSLLVVRGETKKIRSFITYETISRSIPEELFRN